MPDSALMRIKAPLIGAKGDLSTTEPQLSVAQTPTMSEIPTMKQQGERMAVLMEQLSKESNPDIRRRIMAEAMCPQ